MNYHQPDTTWEVFGLNSFEQFEEALIVKGKFHSLVPQDVSESYLQAEYMMAGAYYHHPQYSEALSKILRIFEMAIKLKCDQLKIKRKGKRLYEIMTLVDNAEPAKLLSKHFTAIRSLRNYYSHPERNDHTGAISHGYIVKCVSLLNTLFLPQEIFITNHSETERMKNVFEPYQNDLFILNLADGRFLVKEISIRTSLRVAGKWKYVLYALPVFENSFENYMNHKFLKPFCFPVENLSIKHDTILARIPETSEAIIIQRNKNKSNQTKFETEHIELKKVPEQQIYMCEINNEVEIDKVENKFLLDYLHRVRTEDY